MSALTRITGNTSGKIMEIIPYMLQKFRHLYIPFLLTYEIFKVREKAIKNFQHIKNN